MQGLSGFKVKADAVDAVTGPGGSWAIGKDMTQMAVARAAAHFDPVHPVAMVMMFGYRVGCCGRGKARPAGAAVEFAVRFEQQGTATAAEEIAIAFLDIQCATERPFGPRLAQDMILHGG